MDYIICRSLVNYIDYFDIQTYGALLCTTKNVKHLFEHKEEYVIERELKNILGFLYDEIHEWTAIFKHLNVKSKKEIIALSKYDDVVVAITYYLFDVSDLKSCFYVNKLAYQIVQEKYYYCDTWRGLILILMNRLKKADYKDKDKFLFNIMVIINMYIMSQLKTKEKNSVTTDKAFKQDIENIWYKLPLNSNMTYVVYIADVLEKWRSFSN